MLWLVKDGRDRSIGLDCLALIEVLGLLCLLNNLIPLVDYLDCLILW